jgi:Heparinase II/III-like protein
MNLRASLAAGAGSTIRLLVCAVLLVAAGPRCAQAESGPSSPSTPLAGDILSRLHTVHPRLLAGADDFTRLKDRIATDPLCQAWQAKLHDQTRVLLAAPPSKYEIPDGLRLLDTSRRVVDRVYLLGLCYRLEGKPEYAARAWAELEAAANFPDWNPRHFLDTAEMTHAFAIAYDWLYDVWTPEQRRRLRDAIVEKGFKPALALYRARSSWTRVRHNWNQVCNGGLGLGALALADEEPALAGEILESALKSLPLAMTEFAPDGAWQEGPGYWNYATSYNVLFLAALQTALDTDFGLSDMEAFRDTGLFPIYLTGPLGRTFNYADGGDHTIRAPQMFWLARRFKQPAFAWYERQNAAPAVQDLLWYHTPGASPRSLSLPLDKYFRGAEVAVLRSDWENSKALFIGFKGGDNKANHSHLDLGSFVFDASGVRWAVDLGADDYNLPGYFGSARWHYYRLRAEGQNTLVINPTTSPDQDPAAAAPILRFQSNPNQAFAIADLTPAYHHAASKVHRGICLLDRKQVVVQDEIQTLAPSEVWWFMHTPASVKIEDDGHAATLQQAGAELRAEILSPPEASFQILSAQPLPDSCHPPRQAENQGVRKLAIHLAGLTQASIAVRLIPLSRNDAQAPVAPKLSPLSDW